MKKKHGVLGLVLVSFILNCCSPKAVEQIKTDQPNFVIIFCDDLDFDELNFYSNDSFPCYTGAKNNGFPTAYGSSLTNKKYFMPNLDKFAEESALFTHFYVPSSVCTPARYSILTGRYPSRSPVLQLKYKPGSTANVTWNSFIDPSESTVVESLHERGYKVGLLGKWHNGSNGKQIMIPRSMDDYKDPVKAARIKADYNYLIKYLEDTIGFDKASRIYYDNHKYLNLEWLAEGVLEFIDENKKNPFFMYIALPIPHAQYNNYSDWESLATPEGLLKERPEGMPGLDKARMKCKMHGISKDYSMSIWLDDFVGAVMDKLKNCGLKDNTIVIFTSDHQSRGKFTCYESCRIPFLIRYPGVIEANRQIDELCVLSDIIPTILHIIDKKEVEPGLYDGQSLLPVLKSKVDIPWRKELLLEVAYSRAIVTRNWKYIANRPPPEEKLFMAEDLKNSISNNVKRQVGWDCYPNWNQGHVIYDSDVDFPNYFDADQLYNLNTDIFEQNNLAYDPEYAEILKEMKERLKKELEIFPHTFGEFKTE